MRFYTPTGDDLGGGGKQRDYAHPETPSSIELQISIDESVALHDLA
jgi:hypothetical protein